MLFGLAYFGGCSGGQSGDSGLAGGDEVCTLRERREVDHEEAEALGYAVDALTRQAFEDASSATVELLLTAPPSVWLDRGLEPPSDRAVPAVLTIRPRGTVELRDREPSAVAGAECPDEAAPLVDVELAIESLDTTLIGQGTLGPVQQGQAPILIHEAKVDIAELGACEILLGADDAERWPRELACTLAVYGESQCYDRAPLNRLPIDARSGLDSRDFIARGLQALPLELGCEGGARRAVLDVAVTFPDSFCGPPQAVPVLVYPQLGALGLEAPLPGYVWSSREASCTWLLPERCQGRAGNGLTECLESFPAGTGETPRAEPCSDFVLNFGDPTHEVSIEVETAADGTILVDAHARSYARSKDPNEPDVTCQAQRVLAP